jgi:hypothetical protein
MSLGECHVDPLRPPVDELLASWRRRVVANRDQVNAFREAPDGPDFYAPVAERFRDDPLRTGDAVLDALVSLAQADDVWLDIGAGGGRYALPLALKTRQVIALDHSSAMLRVLREGMEQSAIANVEVVEADWPTNKEFSADVALISNVGYDIEEIGPFLDAMERSSRRLCVAHLRWRNPTSDIDELWPAVHGVERATLPNLRDLLALLLARERPFEVNLIPARAQTYTSPEEAMANGRRQTWVEPGSEKDTRLRAAITACLIERDGRFAFRWEPNYAGIVSWKPA